MRHNASYQANLAGNLRNLEGWGGVVRAGTPIDAVRLRTTGESHHHEAYHVQSHSQAIDAAVQLFQGNLHNIRMEENQSWYIGSLSDDGKPEGHGMLLYDGNMAMSIGMFTGSKMHGIGMMAQMHKWRYEGVWNNGFVSPPHLAD
jgi:hypothetical protein